ncbi:uncharacterized protein [Halyomorpha halys]|uniref:uncharacterized protein n=1 Tax=Halyomorpha halys TaxID=286706 RepID=UPI0006D4F673|nr:uncharacterized protein LOC106688030 [Halyomorpha halys]
MCCGQGWHGDGVTYTPAQRVNMFLALLAAHLFYCSQCLSLSNQLKTYTKNELVFGKYAEYLPQCGPGEYLNLCGECVSGKTEKEDEFGKDSCGICGGLETCKVQCSDPMDILEEDEETNGCLKFISMSPTVLDIAESPSASVCIFGEGISKETIVECSISKDGESEIPIKTQALEDKIELTFPLPSKDGKYDLHCNTSTAVEFTETLSVVDTNKLLPTAVNSPTLTTWKENQVTVIVSKMAGPVDILCFAKTSSDDLLFSEWTSQVEGNSLSSTVKCPPFVPVRTEELEFGLAYSIQGIKTAKTVKVMATAEAPRAIKAVFVTEASKIIVTFDQNLEEGTGDCSTLFSPETVLLIGSASFCKITVNEVHISLRGTALKPNTTLSFKEEAVKTKFSESAGGGSVEVILVEKVKDNELADNSLECKKSLKLLATTVPTAANYNMSDIPIGQRQRLNLMAWRSARASTPNPKARSNSTEKENGVQSSEESADKQTEATETIAHQDSNQVWLQLRGPSSVDVENHAVFQAMVHSCGTPLNPSKYKWSVASDKDKMDTYFVNGPKLKVPPGALLPNSKYKLTVQAFDGEKPIADQTVQLETYIQNFAIRLQDAELVVGNGHAIDIDASRFLDVDSKAIKLNWTCKKGFCYLPGKDKRPLDNLEALAQPHLRLPAKTLAIGRYLFALEASSEETKLDEAEVEVAVVSGQPPYISDLTIKEDKTSFNLLLKVSEIRLRCQLFWSVVPRVGYSYINISQDPMTVEGLPTRPQDIEMSIAMDKDLLIPGSKTLLRVSADCGRAGHVYRQFRFFVPDGLNGFHLEVEPQVGQALQTEFVFRIIEKQSSGKAVYSFGYEENGIQSILYSGINKEFKTYLGCCKFKTFATLCMTKSNCITQYGPEIEMTLPSGFNNSISRFLSDLYKEQVMSSDYEEAFANLKMVLPILEKVDLDMYKEYCKEAEHIIVDRIAAHTDRLKKNKDYLHESVRMLDAASNLMATIRLSEESLNTILQFRDLVHANTRSLSEKIKENKISENLPPEPRISSSDIVTAITMNHKTDENFKKKPFEAAKSALESKIELLKRFDNDLMHDHRERSMILNSILYYSLRQGKEDHRFDPVYSVKENLRQKRDVGDVKAKTIGKKDMETVLKATVLPLLQKDGNWNKAREETLKLISIIFDYSKDLCNDASAPHIIGAEQDLVLLGSVPLKSSEKEKVKFPFCTSWCPSVKDLLNVSLVNTNPVSNSSEGVCFSIASLRDDILTNLIPAAANSTSVRRSAVYWLDAMKYQHGVVPGIVYNVANDSKVLGHMIVQFPVWPDTTNSSNNTTLECWMFTAQGWNNTTCVKIKEMPKENITSLQCNCSFPGFYSVFAVEEKKLDQELVTTKKEIPSTSSTKFIPMTTPKRGPTTLITTTTSSLVFIATVSTDHTTTIVQKTSQKQDIIKTSVTSTLPKDLTTTLLPIPSTTIMSRKTTSSSVLIKTSTSTIRPITNVVTPPYDNDVRTVPSIYQPYRYSATFRINESYVVEVGEMKEKFEEHIEDQLQKILNMSEAVTVDAWKDWGKIAVALRIPENKLQEAGYSIALLKDILKNGSLVLTGIRDKPLNIPAQDIVLTQRSVNAKSAITVFVTIVFIFVAILIGSVVAAFYLRNSREQRCIRITQDLHPDPPAPKYLRLHDSVSLDSSGPSSPQTTEMESSLAVLTRPQRRGYETMETFSHFPGNI